MSNAPVDSASTIDWRRWYYLILLTLVMIFSFCERYALGILIQPIKAEFHLSDTQVGLLTGLAFSVAYALVVLPIAMYADKSRKRRNIICIALVTWSVLTALYGACRSYWQLLLTRFLIGGAASGSAPASHSILMDLYPLSARSTALGIFSAGSSAGLLVAYLVCAPLEVLVGWRWAFAILSLVPGLALALLMLTTVKEPDAIQDPGHDHRPVVLTKGSVRELITSPVMLFFLIGAAGATFLAFGQTVWTPAYIERSFHISRSALGFSLAMTQALGMTIGMVAGGPLSDFLWKKRGITPPLFVNWCVAAAIIPVIGIYVSPHVSAVYICSGLAALPVGALGGPIGAICQTIAKPTQRATAAALNALSLNIVAIGIAPFVVGGLSDLLADRFHEDSLRWALLGIVCLVAPMTLYYMGRVHAVWNVMLKERGILNPFAMHALTSKADA
ncbi:MAG: hypothetical protein QOD95_160 [Gammaproteobacteria bacterium]|nr:hypothetical protein [Gammaproteobacteria bacterium]